ncbi:MAG TPA: MgtC/SapB family protein [Caulobacteraceae bacterium]
MQLYVQIAGNLACAWLAGGLIGLERSYHGRAAGFRTHCIVAIAAAAAIMAALIPALQPALFHGPPSIDNAGRVAQGIMTGIGFLGAGVIFKTGVNIQGLTTAASVWATAAIGLLFGVGAYLPATLATGAVLASLIVLRWVEMWMPAHVYVWSSCRFAAERAPTGHEFRALLAAAGASLSELSYARKEGGTLLEYSGVIRMPSPAVLHALAERLRHMDGLIEYDLERISK